LIIVSALDLKEAPAGTMVWWQLLKGLNQLGTQIIAVPFIGRPIDTPWWRCYSNPAESFSRNLYFLSRRLSSIRTAKTAYNIKQGNLMIRVLNAILVRSWHKFLDSILKKEKNVDAIIFCDIPINLIQTLPAKMEHEWGTKSVYYEIDMPDILPSYGGFHFSYYNGADLSEYSLFLSNSAGVKTELQELGARRIDSLFFGADPEIYSPIQVEKNVDVFFSGFGSKFREHWIEKMLIRPSLQENKINFCVSGKSFPSKHGQLRFLGYLPFNDWKIQCCASRININISRRPHAETMLSSTLRIFELCSLRSCVVSNKHMGLDQWFEPEKEIFILEEEDDPLELYHFLLNNPEVIERTAQEARSRILKEHTYRHRAERLLKLVQSIK
jgi:hypothetical protein